MGLGVVFEEMGYCAEVGLEVVEGCQFANPYLFGDWWRAEIQTYAALQRAVAADIAIQQSAIFLVH